MEGDNGIADDTYRQKRTIEIGLTILCAQDTIVHKKGKDYGSIEFARCAR